MNAEITKVEQKIDQLKIKIQKIGSIRPGSLNQQYKDPKAKSGAYLQLNYTHKMKTYTEYVRPICKKQIQAEILEYKKLKKLIDQWIELAIKASKLKVKNMKKGM